MTKLSKHNKKVLIIIGICCLIVLVGGIILIINENIEGINWEDYEKAKFIYKDKNSVGMTDKLRKEIFWELIKLQDSFMKKNPYNTQSQADAYKIIADRYGVLEYVVRDIAIRGIKEKWPQPPLK